MVVWYKYDTYKLYAVCTNPKQIYMFSNTTFNHTISLQRSDPWLMVGDFNEIISNTEKHGGRKHPESSFLPFKNMISACGMIDFSYSGNFFSWAGRRRFGRVQCRLDRALGNEDWHQAFSHTDVEYLL